MSETGTQPPQTQTTEPAEPDTRWIVARFFRALGPALIVACVVLGPGSILTASKTGAEHGYGMLWVLVLSIVLMVGMVALSARLGVSMKGTLCDELTERLGAAGRPVAALVGITIFLIAACFQFGNNTALVAAIETFMQGPVEEGGEGAGGGGFSGMVVPLGVMVALNGIIILTLFGVRRLYKPLERMMMVLVGLMLLGFAGNLLFEWPSVLGILKGLVPQFPESAREGFIPQRGPEGGVVDPLAAVTGMFGTTFSVAGAFYQSYLVREKGWGRTDLRRGLVDSIAGIAVLGLITMMILVTSATALRGEVEPDAINDLSDVALQLEALFGSGAKILFSVGVFAGAFSSLLVNAMIGGSMLSDGLGFGGRMDQPATRAFTVSALAVGMATAGYIFWQGSPPVGVIVFAQGLTVIGLPLLAIVLIYLATRPEMRGERRVPWWLIGLACVGCAVSLFFAVRTAWSLYLNLSG